MGRNIIRHLEYYGFPDQNKFLVEPSIDFIDKKQDWEIHKIARDLYSFRFFQKKFNDGAIKYNEDQDKDINAISAYAISVSGVVDSIIDEIGGISVPTIKDQVIELSGNVESFIADFDVYSAATKEDIDFISGAVDSVSGALTSAINDEINRAVSAETALDDEIVAVSGDLATNYYTKADVDGMFTSGTSGIETWVDDNYAKLVDYNAFVSSATTRFDDLDGIDTQLGSRINTLSSHTSNEINRIDGDITSANGRIATNEFRIDGTENRLDVVETNKVDTSAFTAAVTAITSTTSILRSDLDGFTATTTANFNAVNGAIAGLAGSKADATAVTNSLNAETAAREAADNFLSGKVDTNTYRIQNLEDEDVINKNRMSGIEGDLSQEVTNRQNGDTALIGASTDPYTADTIWGAKKYAENQRNAAETYTDTLTASTLNQSTNYTDLQIGNVNATISGLATKSYVDIADNQVRTDLQTIITQTATSVSNLVTAEANRAGGQEASLRSDLDGLGDSLNSVATLVNKITDWDGTGTYQGIGNGAMDIMHQELHNLISQFNGLIVTLTNKGILP